MNEPLINGGYILLSRRIIESEIFKKPPLYLKVWVYLLSSAQHKKYKTLDKGQLFTSIPEIQEACSHMVGYRKETPTKDQIYNILEWLRKRCEDLCESNDSTTMITTTKATHGLLVNIEKYSFYQNPNNYESNDESNNENDTNGRREQRQPDNINKNDKNDKNIYKNNVQSGDSTKPVSKKDLDQFFEDVWKLYPNKKGKGQVSDSKKKELYKVGIEHLTRAIERYKTELKKDASWRKPQNGSTFFNSGYFDYLDNNYSPSTKQQKQSTAKVNKFNAFPQRDYSEDDFLSMEQRLLER